MINTKTMYSEYNGKVETELEELTARLTEVKSGIKYLKDCLIKGKVYIESATNIRYEKIDNIKSEQQVYAFKFKFDKILSCPDFNKQMCTDYLLSYVKAKKDLNRIEKRIEFLKSNSVSYAIYAHVLKSFNKKIIKAILKGYEFSFGFGLSSTRIRKKRRKKAAINWKESNAEKQRLLDEGKVPFEVLERDEKGRPIKNNGGEDWFIYHVSDWTYWWYWRKEKCVLPNHVLYSFVPTGNNHAGTGAKQQLNSLTEEYKFQTFRE